MNRDAFSVLVRDALAHLYDLSYLSRHSLNEVLGPGRHDLGGQYLHRTLLEGIEQLRPPDRVPPTASSWRPYLVLSLRYAEERTTEQVAQEIGISSRQLRREHAHGVHMLTDLLWEKRQPPEALAETGVVASVVDSEVSRLGDVRSETLTSLDTVTQSVLSTLERHAASHHVTLSAQLPRNLPRLPVERAALRQVLLNLLTHVIDAAGAGTITMSARRQGGDLILTIRHQGQHPPAASGDDQDGRLAVAERLVSAQGGQLQVTTDGGLALTLVLPAHPAPVVLVIDDNPEMIQLFRRYLGGGLYEVVGAGTGDEGMRLAQEFHPFAVTLDVMIPDQDGWEILQNLKNLSSTKNIPVIVCSVLNEQELAFSLGASQFVPKPVTQQMLLTALAGLPRHS